MITTFRAVGNCAYLSFASSVQEGYQLDSGIYVEPDRRGRQEDNAASIATVMAVTQRLFIPHLDGNKTRIEIQPGDKVAVNYLATSDGDHQDGYFEHKNVYRVDGELFWKVPPECFIAVWREDHEHSGPGTFKTTAGWQALGDCVLVQPVVTETKSSLIIIPDAYKQKVEQGRGVLISGDCGADVGQQVFYDHRYASTYKFENGEEYTVVPKNFVHGVYNEN